MEVFFRSYNQLMNYMKAKGQLCIFSGFYCWHFIWPSLVKRVQKASSNTSGNGVIPNTAVRWNSLSNWWNFNLLCSCPFQMVTFPFSLHWDSVDVHFLRKMYLCYKRYHSVFSSGNRLMKTINYSIQEYLKRWLTDDSYFLGLVFINFYINSPNVQLDWNVLWNCLASLKLGSP